LIKMIIRCAAHIYTSCREEEPLIEERSKSDGEQVEEDDDDAVPLKIQAVALNKGCKLLLSNSWLKTVPAEVWDLTNLTELDLSANYLKKISKSIGNLSQLKKLVLPRFILFMHFTDYPFSA
jgi:hypothetical protein